jgi:xanthine dehydrogenase accessory factor
MDNGSTESDLFEKIHTLRSQGDPFVVATVVWVEKPTSARPGAKAVITGDGVLTGWIGGSCAEPTVKREARKALEDGQPRLLRLCPPEKLGDRAQDGVTEVPMTCISGGTLEIFIEPLMAQPHLVVVGHLPVARALAVQGKSLGFYVTVAGLETSTQRFPQADRVLDTLDFSQLEIRPNAYIVVASHGNYDEDALLEALHSPAAYVALVSSRRRAGSIIQYLKESGVTEERLAQLKVPAGLDIGAATPEEIALSILAEIVQHRRQGGLTIERAILGSTNVQTFERLEERDPVCGMLVEIASARYVSEYNGHTYYFCAKGCQHSFEADPERYLSGEMTHGR